MLGFGVTALMLVGSAAVHYYLWIRLVRDTTRPGTSVRRLATWGVVLSALLAPGTRILTPLFDPSDGGGGRFLAWPGYVLIGVLLYLLPTLVILELPRALALRRWRRAGQRADATAVRVPVPAAASVSAAGPAASAPAAAPAPAEVEAEAEAKAEDRLVGRRLFLGRAVGTLAGATALGTVGYGMSSALGDPLIKRVPVTLSKVNPRLAGLRIAVVSDIHLGPLLGRSHTERIVRMINGLQADVVTIVGDLADGTASQLGPAARPLKGLESRYGAFFVTGNHEYLYDGVEDWLDEMRNVGVRPLVNERVEIRHNGAYLDLAGVEDLAGQDYGRGPDLGKALGGRDLSRPVVLLAHQPVFADEAARHGVDLQLSGHTHGGQMFPLTAITKLANPVNSGLGKVDDTKVYVTNGAGFFGPPVRVGAPADITLLELRSPQA
ncbi:metallophosphoesterase [Streptomyces sp. AP-93]|uniref:metallophosphoesterase n=1 Tax=Streptomyces sp. AP-93 TaxID=2929048 RepID=UPI001FAF3F3E|nr:metallophosphoesterase [Streptomyces sp. AP-93]MCJ0870880.1 metallophosphoesterase [Streptomyces sp. AP-93]